MNNLPACILHIIGTAKNSHLWVSVPWIRGASNEERYNNRSTRIGTVPFSQRIPSRKGVYQLST